MADITLSDGDNQAIYEQGWKDAIATVGTWANSWIPYAPYTLDDTLDATVAAQVATGYITIPDE